MKPSKLDRLTHSIFDRSPVVEHAFTLCFYLALALGLTWPLAANFTAALIGSGDPKHSLWMLWHVQQAVFGNEPLYQTNLLYYPHGITLLVNNQGPLTGLLALPFWWLGPEATYNSMMVLGFWLAGYGLWLLARQQGVPRWAAVLAGVIYMSAPQNLIRIGSHLPELFTLGLPFFFLSLSNALDPAKPRHWLIAPAFWGLFMLFHSGQQFVFAAIAAGFVTLYTFWSHVGQRRQIAWRGALTGLVVALCAAPLLWAIVRATVQVGINVERSFDSFQYQPDALELFLPARFSRFLGATFAHVLYLDPDILIETTIYLCWTGLLLCFGAFISKRRAARLWVWFACAAALVALGPELKLFGQTQFTKYQLPIIMPYAFLTSLPGLNFWRTPTRFMMVGNLGFALAASFGLAWFARRAPQHLRYPILAVAIALVLFETWPVTWPTEPLRPVPPFYQQIAQDPQRYGVFDLPFRPYQDMLNFSWHVYYSSYYQMYQMTHGKGIADGYISRYYDINPLFGHFLSDTANETPLLEDMLVNGQVANRYANAQYELAKNNFRYVVVHKPQVNEREYKPGAWGEKTAQTFVKNVFASQPPLVDDALTTVYQVNPITDVARLTPTIALRESREMNLTEILLGQRWAFSPATFYIVSPRPTLASLDVTVDAIRGPQNSSLTEGVLTLATGDGITSTANLVVSKTARLSLPLSPGSQIITLTLQSVAPKLESTRLDFAIRTINLLIDERWTPPPDVLGQSTLVATHGRGWYALENRPNAPAIRWAASPAELMIYSPNMQAAKLELKPACLYEPNNPSGTQGLLYLSVNDGAAQTINAQVGQLFATTASLRAGWNRVVLRLAAGNFRPADFQPAGNDRRQLSFCVEHIEVKLN